MTATTRHPRLPTPEVSVTGGNGVTEGGDAAFTITASPASSASLDVTVSVASSDDYGVTTGARTATISTSGTGTLIVATSNDIVDEADGSVTATVGSGQSYTVSATGGAATVLDLHMPVVPLKRGACLQALSFRPRPPRHAWAGHPSQQ